MVSRSKLFPVLIAAALGCAALNEIPSLRAQVYKVALPATTWVISPIDKESGTCSQGTGVLIDSSQRLMLTAYHVVADRKECIVYFPISGDFGSTLTSPEDYLKKNQASAVKGTVVLTSESKDLAVIQLDSLPPGAKAMPLALSSPDPGDILHAIGNSGSDVGALWRYRHGTVRQVYSRVLMFKSLQVVEARVVEAQMPTNPGDSGGPMFNDACQLVAITSNRSPEDNLVDYGIDVQEIQALVFGESTLKEICAKTPPLLEANLSGGSKAPEDPVLPWWTPDRINPIRSATEPPAATWIKPKAEIQDVVTTHNVYRNGRLGVEMVAVIDIEGLRGSPCDVVLTICGNSGRGLQPGDRSPRTPSGHLGTSIAVTPIYDHAKFTNLQIFFPYNEISAVTPPGAITYQLALDVYAGRNHGFITQTPWWEELVRNY